MLYLDRVRLLAGFFIFLLFSGCSSVSILPDTLPQIVELAEVPFFPQDKYQCGPAALATVLNYRGLEVTPEKLVPQIYLPERKGSLQIEVAATARGYGMLAYPLATELPDLLAEVAAGNPVLVLQNLAFDTLPQWHYAVVVGYDLEQQEIVLRSGKHRRWRSKLSAFSNTWKRSGRWALVILPPDQVPQTAKLESFLKSAVALEVTGKHKVALSAYAAASTRWPDDKRVWLALGNGAFKLNRLDQAHLSLKRAALLDPTDSTVLNNLAYVYLAAGCPEQANESIRQALLLHPENKNLQESKQEIETSPSVMLGDSCGMN